MNDADKKTKKQQQRAIRSKFVIRERTYSLNRLTSELRPENEEEVNLRNQAGTEMNCNQDNSKCKGPEV